MESCEILFFLVDTSISFFQNFKISDFADFCIYIF